MNRVNDERNGVDLLIYEVSDDALENMGSAPVGTAANYTFYFCTQLDLCPGP